MNQEEKIKAIQNLWMRFNSNIGALYSFFEKLTVLADQIDEEKLQAIVNELEFIFKDKLDIKKDVRKYIPSVDDLDVQPDFSKDKTVQEITESIKDPEVINVINGWGENHPHRLQRLKRAYSKAFNDPPVTGILIRRSMLVSLITFFEIFLSDLYKCHYLMIGTSQEAAEKEAKKLMGGDWRNKMFNLNKIGLGIPFFTEHVDTIYEYTQRRHLTVHNDGVVDQKYKNNIPSNKYDIGDHLLVSTQYFQNAIDNILLFGFFLYYNQLQQISDDEQFINKKLDEFVISTLEKQRFQLILLLAENRENLALSQERIQVLEANRAIAYRGLNSTEEVDKIVNMLEKEEHSWKVDLAICMLKNDIKSLKVKMTQIPSKVNLAEILLWPLFDPVKDQVWFRQLSYKKKKQEIGKTVKRR
ncbi:MAG: hypothetical protein U0V18_07470 [Anaerolineales bacterium]